MCIVCVREQSSLKKNNKNIDLACQEIVCHGCPGVKALSNIEVQGTLECDGCPNLVSVSDVK